MRPWPSTGTRTARSRPSPSRPSDLVSVGCASSPTMTVSSGAPMRPSLSTSQPTSASTLCRAAASAVKLAIVAPVTKLAAQSCGRPNSSQSQRLDTFSSAAIAGVTSFIAEFWSQAVASQFAATVTGMEPPITKPKKRGPAIATDAGEPISSSRASVSASSRPSPDSASSKPAVAVIASGVGATRRSASDSR